MHINERFTNEVRSIIAYYNEHNAANIAYDGEHARVDTANADLITEMALNALDMPLDQATRDQHRPIVVNDLDRCVVVQVVGV